MGVPKFFRWLSERYPKINQPIKVKPTSPPPNIVTISDEISNTDSEKTANGASGVVPEEEEKGSSLEDCFAVPEFDRLYIDANGILHGASHNNGAGVSNTEDDPDNKEFSREEIVKNVCYYLDRIVQDIVKPKELLFFAIDGVAPRAKLCQQRSRRYRSGKEQELFSGLHLLGADDDQSFGTLERTLDGRYSGTIHTADAALVASNQAVSFIMEEDDEIDEEEFHLHAITPGTKFLSYASKEILKHIQHKLETDSRWQHLKVIFSGPEVPGEGEHKIMQFIREQKFSDRYNHNTRHCLVG
jgi:5'-3' exonuclease